MKAFCKRRNANEYKGAAGIYPEQYDGRYGRDCQRLVLVDERIGSVFDMTVPLLLCRFF